MEGFNKLLVVASLAFLIGIGLVWGLTKQPMEETVCQISTNNALVDIPLMKSRLDKFETRLQALEAK